MGQMEGRSTNTYSILAFILCIPMCAVLIVYSIRIYGDADNKTLTRYIVVNTPQEDKIAARPPDYVEAFAVPPKAYNIPDIPAKVAQKLCAQVRRAGISSNHKFVWKPLQEIKGAGGGAEEWPTFQHGCYSWRWSQIGGRISYPLLEHSGFFHLVKSADKDCRPGISSLSDPQKDDVKNDSIPTIFVDHGRVVQLCKSVSSVPATAPGDDPAPFKETQVLIRIAPNLRTMYSVTDMCVQWDWISCSGFLNMTEELEQNTTCGYRSCWRPPGRRYRPQFMPPPENKDTPKPGWVMPMLISKSKVKSVERTKMGRLCNYWLIDVNQGDQLCLSDNFDTEVEIMLQETLEDEEEILNGAVRQNNKNSSNERITVVDFIMSKLKVECQMKGGQAVCVSGYQKYTPDQATTM